MAGKRIALTLLAAALAASPASAQDDTWTWRKVIAPGKAIEIKGVIGDISATPASGNEVQVVAKKSGRSSDASDVVIEVHEHARGVTICAMYPNRGRRPNECLPGAEGNSSSYNNDTEVEFEVRVPRGVLFTGKTVIGDVDAIGMTADVDAGSVTGDVRVETTEFADASTVSGSVRVRMGRTDWQGNLRFSSVSGDVVLELPENLNTDVEMTTVSGSLESDWPMTASSRRWGPRHLNGRIGTGGRGLKISTVSGSVELRKAGK